MSHTKITIQSANSSQFLHEALSIHLSDLQNIISSKNTQARPTTQHLEGQYKDFGRLINWISQTAGEVSRVCSSQLVNHQCRTHTNKRLDLNRSHETRQLRDRSEEYRRGQTPRATQQAAIRSPLRQATLTLGTTSLSTKYAMPIELWDMIFQLALAQGQEPQDEFCWVQAVSSTDKLLHCREVDLSGKKCGEYISTKQLRSFEKLVYKPSEESNNLNDDLQVQYKAEFTMSLPVSDEAFLFHEVQVVDVIKHIEGGNCSLCKNQRLVTKDSYEAFVRGRQFDGYPGHEHVPCPLCIGRLHSLHCIIQLQDIRNRAADWIGGCYVGQGDIDEEEFDEDAAYEDLAAWTRGIIEDCGYGWVDVWAHD